MVELTVYHIMKRFGDNLILNNITFTIYDKERAAIVGANGCGKSTLLKLIAGIEPLDRDDREDNCYCRDKGWIKIPKGQLVGYLEQLPDYPEGSKVIDILKSAFKEIYNMEEKLRSLEEDMVSLNGENLEKALKQYSELQEIYEVKGGYSIDEKLSKICSGLKFDEAFLNKDFNILSGGEKTTVSLGKILLESPDILLLDEPTNHLDMDSVEWLEGYLKNYNGMVIIVSHDRYFLDNIVTKIIEIEDKRNMIYKGNYSDYVEQKEENMLQQLKDYRLQQNEITSMENSIKSLRNWNMFTRAMSIQKKLNKLDLISKPVFEKQNMKFSFMDTERSGFNVIKGSKIYKSFGDKTILNDAFLSITSGEKAALIGPNGSGKTTFLNMLLGNVEIDSGSLELGANVKYAYLPQNITFNNEEDTVIGSFREDKFILEGKAREYLSRFMFFGKDVYQQVKFLSGGERVRLKLAMLLYNEINLLILDEPTNHLDIDSIETLETSLEDFKGTIFFISHDRYFINNVCTRVIALEECKLVSYEGNYDFYKNIKNQPEITKGQAVSKASILKKPEIRIPGQLKLNFSELEDNINVLEDELKRIEESMAEAGSDYTELSILLSRKEKLNKELDEKLNVWLSLTNDDAADSAGI